MGTKTHVENEERLRLMLEIVLLCAQAPAEVLSAIYLLILQLKRRQHLELGKSVSGASRVFVYIPVGLPLVIGA